MQSPIEILLKLRSVLKQDTASAHKLGLRLKAKPDGIVESDTKRDDAKDRLADASDDKKMS